ncbi:MAG: aminopeptidase [Lentimicrobiaceae bacterium]|nr:aminopeptidase [Lentimicrobiaceae bacterium]
MKFQRFIRLFTLSVAVLLSMATLAQTEAKKDSGYVFTIDKQVKATPVKDQYSSGTCWSYSTLAFLESELLRMGKPEYDFSEMYCVRKAYEEKAVKYVRYHGECNFGGGGENHDVLHTLATYGLIPEQSYTGLTIGEKKPIHGEMDEVLKDYLDGVIKNKNNKISPVWFKGYLGILDAYLGEVPEKFTYNNKEYTPENFAKSLGLYAGDYVSITSFLHHPFYEKFAIELPDNWANGTSYNLPLDEMMLVIDNALSNGYSIAWAADVSEKGFSWKNGVAIVPETDTSAMTKTERDKWDKLSEKEKTNQLYTFEKPGKEKIITPQIRQEAYDNYQTTDDHGIQIVGFAHDQNGTKYYLVKNSWNTSNIYDGYFYASEAYVKYKTISIMVHKDALPKGTYKKLRL